ncbi:GTPase HflX [Tianweitania sediminis]|uniref:GTPase HflX n=1 Tax=Tianweitania sediminis TaxID=1502156 RepID=UPI00361AE171
MTESGYSPPGPGEGTSTGRAIVVVPVLTRQTRGEDDFQGRPRLGRSPDARLEEAVGLALAIDLEPVFTDVVMLADPRPATLLGSGKVDELAEVVREANADLAIVDHPLTPVQQRNLEKALNAKVLDRTGLILEIFGRRARTKEGSLQVELAHLNYQRGRLVRSWTHLERQRGGAGFLGGPGETQIEADRRLLQDKILKLKRELETVRRTRDLHRAKRRKVPFPIVAIVGYTNAGKSTLFNRLTGAGVLAENMLFATLDPTLRRVQLPHGTTIILSDTVGFISDLPTHLVAAFRATLEEVVEADLVIHLRDISDPDTAAQAEDVERILRDLGIDAQDEEHVVEVWNKVDLVDDQTRERLLEQGKGPVIAVSAVTGEGISHLTELIEARISGKLEDMHLVLGSDRLRLLDGIYHSGEVTEREDREDGSVALTLRTTQNRKNEIEAWMRDPD